MLDVPTIVAIIIFGIVFVFTIFIHCYRNEITIIRIYIWDIVQKYIRNNRINIDTGTAECTVVDDNEIFELNMDESKEYINENV